MTSAFRSQITDELLSAYIDGEVNSEEARLVEQAMIADPEIAWEVESLRQTVQLLGQLPAVALPQTFAISEMQVADVVATRRADRRRTISVESPWQRLLTFFGGGNLLLRNAAAMAVVAFLAVVAGDLLTATPAPLSGSPAPVSVAVQSEAVPEMAQFDEPSAISPAAGSRMAPLGAGEEANPEESVQAEAVQAEAVPADAVAEEAEPLIPDAAPFSLAAEAAGGEADGRGGAGGGGGDAPAAPALAAAPADRPSEEVVAAASMSTAPAEAAAKDTAETAEDDIVGAAAMSAEDAPPAAPPVAESMATPMAAPMAAPMSTSEEIAEVAEAAEAAAAAEAEPALLSEEPVAESADGPPAASVPAEEETAVDPAAKIADPVDSDRASILRLAQILLGMLALALSGLWIWSR